MFPYIHFSPVCEFLVIVHTAKTGLLRCCLYKLVNPALLQSPLQRFLAVQYTMILAIVGWFAVCWEDTARVRIRLGCSAPSRRHRSCTSLKRVATSEFRGNVVEPLACRIQLLMGLLLDCGVSTV